MSERDFSIGITSTDQFFKEALEVGEKIDAGWRPEKAIERLYFGDLPTLLRYLTPKRFELLNVLHKIGPSSINALAKTLGRQYRNVHTDVKELEVIGLVEKNQDGLYFVPWDQISTTINLAA